MKYVESWFVREYPNGVFCLVINTTERWLDFYNLGENRFEIGEDLSDNEMKEILEVPNFLPFLVGGHYIQAESQEKDQIYFYWIPYYNLWFKEGLIKEVLNSEKL